MEAMPLAVRRRIIHLYEHGKATSEIAMALGYCVAAVRRVRRRFRECGTLTPQTHLQGTKGRFTSQRQQQLRELLAAKPDATPDVAPDATLDVALVELYEPVGGYTLYAC